MNRFEYADPRLFQNEIHIRRDICVRLYDGDVKVYTINFRHQHGMKHITINFLTDQF